MRKVIAFVKNQYRGIIIISACVVLAAFIIYAVGSAFGAARTQDGTTTSSNVGGASQSYLLSLMAGNVSNESTMSYSEPGVYSAQHFDIGEIISRDVVLESSDFEKLTITPEVGDGTVHLSGSSSEFLVIAGGGQDSVYIEGGEYDYIMSTDTDCHIVIGNGTLVKTLTALSSSKIDVYGEVEEVVILGTPLTQAIDWEHGFNSYEGALVGSLSVSEDAIDYSVSAAADTLSTTAVFISDKPTNISADMSNIIFVAEAPTGENADNAETVNTTRNARAVSNRDAANQPNNDAENANTDNTSTTTDASQAWFNLHPAATTSVADTAQAETPSNSSFSSSSGSSGGSSSSAASSSGSTASGVSTSGTLSRNLCKSFLIL